LRLVPLTKILNILTTQRLPFPSIPQLAKTDVAYATAQPELSPFYKYSVDIQSFAKVIEDKKKEKINRKLLVDVLKKQYLSFSTQNTVNINIEALINENTFTIVTAHQPSLLLGPLYFVYKIMSVIHLCKSLKAQYPDYQFVPMFVIGGEDHDFEEVNNINIFNKKLVWQNDEKGAVGMMNTATLLPLLEELKGILGESENAKHIFNLIEKNYTSNQFYHTATQALLNDLFGIYGLVVINMNEAELKRQFSPYILREILEQPSQKLVADTQQALQQLGYKAQAFPREINLFYLREQLRERIVFENSLYKVLNTNFVFTKEELLLELENHPEYFSPNVVLRPLYQEVILPNLAYIGGGGELAYWLERKKQFEYFGVNFPILIRRNSVVWIDEQSKNKMEKLSLSANDIFQDIDILTKNYVTKNSTEELNFSQEKVDLQGIFKRIESIAKRVDPTLEKTIIGEGVKQLQALEQLESRVVKAEKQKHETALNQIKSLVQKFCPNGGLQERYDNFLPYYIKYGRDFFDVLLEECDPLKPGIIVIEK
jgi:bacillithiol biosynthesis cysteine-adding enzyme BshC